MSAQGVGSSFSNQCSVAFHGSHNKNIPPSIRTQLGKRQWLQLRNCSSGQDMDFILGCGLLIFKHVLWAWELRGRGFSDARGSGEIIVCVQSFIILKVMFLPILYLFSVQIKLSAEGGLRAQGCWKHSQLQTYTIVTSMPQVLQTDTCFKSFFHQNFSSQRKKKVKTCITFRRNFNCLRTSGMGGMEMEKKT